MNTKFNSRWMVTHSKDKDKYNIMYENDEGVLESVILGEEGFTDKQMALHLAHIHNSYLDMDLKQAHANEKKEEMRLKKLAEEEERKKIERRIKKEAEKEAEDLAWEISLRRNRRSMV